VTFFLQSGLYLAQFNHFLIIYSNFEFINGLNHSLGQIPQDLIVSGNTPTDLPRGIL
jgi:hypothetical protein